jgi:hypothetical protein
MKEESIVRPEIKCSTIERLKKSCGFVVSEKTSIDWIINYVLDKMEKKN